MSKSLFVFLLYACHGLQVSAQINTDSTKRYYQAAYSQLERMLSGAEPPSYEQAIYQVENAWYGGKLDHAAFSAMLDFHQGNIERIIAASVDKKLLNREADLLETKAQKRRLYEQALANYGIYTYLTTASFSVDKEKAVYHEAYRYSNADPMGTEDWRNTQVAHLLDEHSGNCFALSSLFLILSERLHSSSALCAAPGHIWVRHADENGILYNIELSKRAFPGSGTLETITYTPTAAVKSGIAMRTLETKQAIGICLVYLAIGYEQKTGDNNDPFLLQCAETALRYDSLNLNAMLLKAEVLENRLTEGNSIRDLNALKSKPGFDEYQYWITHLFNTGYREMPFQMKNLLVQGWKKDTLTHLQQTVYKSSNVAPNHMAATPYASLSWGLFDEEMRTKPVERFGNTFFDTRARKIVGFAQSDILTSGYNFDPVVFAWNVDPLASKLPSWSPYAFCKDNPIMNFDLDGAFPYTFHIRAFAPPTSFKGSGFEDDHRDFSTYTYASSRIKQSFTVDPTKAQFYGGMPTSDPTIWYGSRKTATDDGRLAATFSRDKSGSARANIETAFEGSNPFFGGAAPNIKVSSSISVVENLKTNTLNVTVDISSKQFPATEALIQDNAGNTVFLAGAAAFGTPLSLVTAGQERAAYRSFDIGINDKGVFQNVTMDGKKYSVEEFNRLGTSKPAGPFSRDERNNQEK